MQCEMFRTQRKGLAGERQRRNGLESLDSSTVCGQRISGTGESLIRVDVQQVQGGGAEKTQLAVGGPDGENLGKKPCWLSGWHWRR